VPRRGPSRCSVRGTAQARWPEEVRRVGACGGHCRGHRRDLGVRVHRTWCSGGGGASMGRVVQEEPVPVPVAVAVAEDRT
jgi:3-phosphoglycerate kinase